MGLPCRRRPSTEARKAPPLADQRRRRQPVSAGTTPGRQAGMQAGGDGNSMLWLAPEAVVGRMVSPDKAMWLRSPTTTKTKTGLNDSSCSCSSIHRCMHCTAHTPHTQVTLCGQSVQTKPTNNRHTRTSQERWQGRDVSARAFKHQPQCHCSSQGSAVHACSPRVRLCSAALCSSHKHTPQKEASGEGEKQSCVSTKTAGSRSLS